MPERPRAFETTEGDYDYVLPSLDFAVDLTDSIKARASYGKSIGRPLWDEIQGGRTLDQLVRINGGTGAQGNPKLKPLESENIDFSVEWYYGESSYVSVGLLPQEHRQLHRHHDRDADAVQPPYAGQGAYFQRSGSVRLPDRRSHLHSQLHLQQPRRRSGRDRSTGGRSERDRTGTIAGLPGDPIANFTITVPRNQRSASAGWLGIQRPALVRRDRLRRLGQLHDGGLRASPTTTTIAATSSRCDGLSDAANLVAFYENEKFQVRAAYNWRDEFLAATRRRQRPAEPGVHRGLRPARPERQLQLERQPDA